MTKIIKSKFKISRRLGVALWGQAKDAFNIRKLPPGQHGEAATRKKYSDFGKQLRAKQQLKGYYNMTEKQFRAVYKEAARLKGDTSENLIALLERRLDAVVYRANLAPTIFSARQLVSHKHITVNGKKLNIPSYKVQDSDIVEIKEKSRKLPIVMEAAQKQEREIPGYMTADLEKSKVTYLRGAGYLDVPYPVQMEPNLVVEFYSR
jgi:small subunit ribosomal protein S4